MRCERLIMGFLIGVPVLAQADVIYWDSGSIWQDVAVLQVVSSTGGPVVLLRRTPTSAPAWFRGFRRIILDPRLEPSAPPGPILPPAETALPTQEVVPQTAPISPWTLDDIASLAQKERPISQQEWDARYRGQTVQWTGEILQITDRGARRGVAVRMRPIVERLTLDDSSLRGSFPDVPLGNLPPPAPPPERPAGETMEVLVVFERAAARSVKAFKPGDVVVYLAKLQSPPRARVPLELVGLQIQRVSLPPPVRRE